MKKTLRLMTIGAALVAALAGCSKDSVTEVKRGEGMRFRMVFDNLTKATETTRETIGTFNVTAILSDSTKAPTEVKTYFEDLKVTVSNPSTGACTTDTVAYWPTGEHKSLNFFAYAPTKLSGTGAFSIDRDAQKLTGFTPVKAAKGQDDIVAANTGALSVTEGREQAVAVHFQHALSEVQVLARTGGSLNVEVLGVKLSHIPSKGEMTFPKVSGTDTTKLSWSVGTATGDTLSYFVKSGTSATSYAAVSLGKDETKSLMGEGGSWMLIPQRLTAWDLTSATPDSTNTRHGAYLSILCRISNAGDGTQYYPVEKKDASGNVTNADKYAFMAIPIATNWEPGKKYVYTVSFNGLKGGYVDPEPSVVPDDGTTGEPKITPEDVDDKPKGDDQPNKPGEDIKPEDVQPITFTVDVTDWVTSDSPVNLTE